MFRFAFSLLITVFMLPTGCSTITVNYDYNSKEDFLRFKTFTWIPSVNTIEDNILSGRLDNSLFKQHVESSVNRNLQTKGFQLVEKEADLFIDYQIWALEKTDMTDWGYGYDTSWGMRNGSLDMYRYSEGILVVDFINTENNRLIWRGTAITPLPEEQSCGIDEEKIGQIVKKLLLNYPPVE